MALVTSIEESGKDRNSIHRPTRCFSSIVESPDGRRCLQLDTVGSSGREYQDKVSQSIQFDRQSAGQLLRLLVRTFPDLTIESGGESEIGESPSEDPDDEALEGRLFIKQHRVRERNPVLIRKKKRLVLRSHGCLQCEACGFDFASFYGELGEGFAECHHRVPLSQLAEASPVRLADLAIVCANCHRMLHRSPFLTVEQLQSALQERKGSLA